MKLNKEISNIFRSVLIGTYLSTNFILHAQNNLKIKIAGTASFGYLSEIVESNDEHHCN